jgi:enoyl-CoA hydratase/carnithine racemase
VTGSSVPFTTMISVPHSAQRSLEPTAVGVIGPARPRRSDYRRMSTTPDLTDARLELHEGIAVVTFDRPERKNAFTMSMGASLGRAYAHCDTDDAVRVVVVTGAGDAFCAGADLAPAEETFAAPRGERTEAEAGRGFTSSPVRPTAWEVRKPVIAAMNGHAIGIGMSLAMQCDVRFMATGAKYGFVHTRRGVLADAHSHWTVPRAIGFARAADLLLSGRHFTAEEAVAIGLANGALPADEVLPTALAYARDLAVNTAPLSVALSKRLLWHQPMLDADECDRLETAYHRVVMGRDDAREGVLAFLERRAPRWTLSPTRDWPSDA